MDTVMIDNARKEIDRINGELTALLVERMKQVDIVGSWKAANGLPVRVPERERAIIEKVCAQGGREFAPELEMIFQAIFSASCRREKRIAEKDEATK